MGWGKARFFFFIGLLALALAGVQNAFLDISEDRTALAASVLADYPTGIMAHDPDGSWSYKGRAAENGLVWPGADTYAAAPTDFWHWSRFWQIMFMALGALWLFWCGYYWPINMRAFGRIFLGILLLIFSYGAYWGGHWATMEHALPPGGVEIAQTAARTWVNGFIWLHGELQSSGRLG